MFTKQKIKKIIISFSIMLLISITLVFHNFLNLLIKGWLVKINVVSSKNNLMVHFVNVGQGDAIAINLPDNKIMLIDTGSEDNNVTLTDYLKENVLHARHNNKIDYLVLTHADMDHIGGTLRLLKNFNVKTVFVPKVNSNTDSYEEVLTYIEANCEYRMAYDDYEIKGKDYTITFLKQMSYDDTNDSSQVIKLSCFNKKFLFAGDVSADVENDFIEHYNEFLDCDVLKVAHHGSKTSSSAEFLMATSPSYSVISVGADNNYGHPTEEVLNRINALGSKVLRTDKDGNILFVVGKDYNLTNLNGKYYVFNLSLDYAYLVVVVDVILLLYIVVIIIKKEKVNKHLVDKTLEY